MRLSLLVFTLVTVTAMPAFATDPEGAKKKFMSGAALYQDGDYELAIPRLEDAVALDPSLCRANLYLGRSHLAVGNHASARDAAEAYKGCCTESELADAEALLAEIPEVIDEPVIEEEEEVEDAAAVVVPVEEPPQLSRREQRRLEREARKAEEEAAEEASADRWDDDEDSSTRWDDEEEEASSRWDDVEDAAVDAAEDAATQTAEDAATQTAEDVVEEVTGDEIEDAVGDVIADVVANTDYGYDLGDEDEVEDVADAVEESTAFDAHESTSYDSDAAVAAQIGTSVDLSTKRRKTAGAVMMGVGGAAAAFGFIWSYSQYGKYYWETDEVMYDWARNTNTAGFAIGVAGASLAGTGLILLIAPSKNNTTALTPGPVTTLTMEF